MHLTVSHLQKSTNDRIQTHDLLFRALSAPLNRLTRWFASRRRAWRGFTVDLDDLGLDDHEIFLDLSCGRD